MAIEPGDLVNERGDGYGVGLGLIEECDSVWLVVSVRENGTIMVTPYDDAARKISDPWLANGHDPPYAFSENLCLRDPVIEIRLWAEERRARDGAK